MLFWGVSLRAALSALSFLPRQDKKGCHCYRLRDSRDSFLPKRYRKSQHGYYMLIILRTSYLRLLHQPSKHLSSNLKSWYWWLVLYFIKKYTERNEPLHSIQSHQKVRKRYIFWWFSFFVKTFFLPLSRIGIKIVVKFNPFFSALEIV